MSCLFGSGSFISGVLILGVGALAIEPTMQVISTHFAKRPIPINRPFDDFDISLLPTFGKGWKVEHIDQPDEELGTSEYTFVEFTRGQTGGEFEQVKLFASYYSDPEDKVPHTPDVCYPPQGAVITKMGPIELNAPGLPAGYREVPLRYIEFKWPERNEVVMYCFCVEGQIRYDREQVRWIMGKPGNKHTYFGLIMVGADYSHGSSSMAAEERCRRLLNEALPVLLRDHYPAEEQLRRQ
jgi:hypothetical protein